MSTQFSEKLIAYLTLLTGLCISGVAIYYSVIGLTAIFAAAVIPIIVMGVILEVGKLIATLWLKQNWNIAPITIKLYLVIAIAILMLLTSMGIFGYLSKAHTDQSLISGDVLSKIAIYDEKIKTSKENIEAKRRELKQMDEAVDQVMVRSKDEKGADKSIALRKSQQRDRTRISQEIEAEQKRLSELNNEAAPIRAEVRKVEAEVGPIKYIAALIYGDNLEENVLEKSVRWVIIMIVVIFDPLAVILLLASQYSFQSFRTPRVIEIKQEPVVETSPPLKEHNPDRAYFLEKELHLNPLVDFRKLKLPKEEQISNLEYLEKVEEPQVATPVDPFEGQEYVTVDGETMHVNVARERMKPKIRPYTQDKEQNDP